MQKASYCGPSRISKLDPVERRQSELDGPVPESCADNGTIGLASPKLLVVGQRFSNCTKFDQLGSYRALFSIAPAKTALRGLMEDEDIGV